MKIKGNSKEIDNLLKRQESIEQLDWLFTNQFQNDKIRNNYDS